MIRGRIGSDIYFVLYFVFWIIHFVFCILYFVFYILYFVFCILYFVFCTRQRSKCVCCMYETGAASKY